MDSRNGRGPDSGTTVLIAALGVVLAVGLVTLLVAGQRSAGGPAPSPSGMTGAPVVAAPVAQMVAHTVTYELDGGQTALDITYVAQGSAIAQVAKAATPWTMIVERHDPAGGALYVSVSARNSGSGPLHCRVRVDGSTVAEGTVAEPGGMVRCSKSLS
ncbi:MmpS family transport accessory protein [Amycolatopsis cynarae]|uniref:MmpS family transport accessory protein n=1 Tax=Amycolatopsis cynarae TaxID=2995223 RepID=A0ABY7B6S0_9PSEU|nr:MmpS family transport accessory protein [Amycolatopsis sp. HUAS 11-8]WAL67995.1 MmpS family transport accessory protein [Amycolatopsis sp. HUAS 11-8]